ncbi:MAG TPA: hypothetical protein VFZ70_01145 [Euzebyales bacterium]
MIDDHTRIAPRTADGEAAGRTVDDAGCELDLDAIAPIGGRRPANADASTLRSPSWRPRVSRRGMLRTAFVGATALGMSALGVFPPAREALADGYDIARYGCNGIGYANCKDCCCSTVCYSCCNFNGWHKRTGIHRLRPNQCYAGGGNRSKDGWFWRACNCRKSNGTTGKRTNRCHDGYTIGDAGALRTICRTRIGCL